MLPAAQPSPTESAKKRAALILMMFPVEGISVSHLCSCLCAQQELRDFLPVPEEGGWFKFFKTDSGDAFMTTYTTGFLNNLGRFL